MAQNPHEERSSIPGVYYINIFEVGLKQVCVSLTDSAGARLWQALDQERPLQVVGTVNAYAALLAERTGFQIFNALPTSSNRFPVLPRWGW